MLSSRFAFATLACCLLVSCGSPMKTSGASGEVAAIEQVVESFRLSIIEKDKARFTSLFFSGDPALVTWQSVLDDPSLRWIKKTRPQSLKARYRPDNNYIAFIDSIVESKNAEEERFTDVEIDTDGEIASVSFSYVYLSAGRPTNNGREKWLLVRTEDGWKITSVIYSVHLPEAGGA